MQHISVRKYYFKIQDFLHKYQLGLISGILVGTSYIPFPPWAIFFCLVPLLYFILTKAKSWKEAFWASWVCQFLLVLIGFHWVAYTTVEFGHLPWIVGILALLAFAAFMHLYFPLVFIVAYYGKKRWGSGGALLCFVPLFSLAEQFWPRLFQWNFGYVFLWQGLPMYQWADVVGVNGLSSLVMIINGLLAWYLVKNPEKDEVLTLPVFWRRLKYPALGIMLFLLGLNLSGWQHGLSHSNLLNFKSAESNENSKLKILAVQGNIGNHEKLYAERGAGFQDYIANVFFELTDSSLVQNGKVDLIAWPETAFPDYLNTRFLQEPLVSSLRQKISSWNTPLLTGAYSKDPPNPNGKKAAVYNGVFILDSQGMPIGVPYHKTHLLAFGEYIPLSETFPILEKWVTMISNFGRGKGPTTLDLPTRFGNISVGPQICYEGLFPEFSHQQVKDGADIIINVTNDSWFGYPFEPRQHMYMTFARAIENRKPVVRITNTGFSAAILSDGTLLERSSLHQPWTGVFEIKLTGKTEPSFYVRWGYALWKLLLITLLVSISGFEFFRRKKMRGYL